MNNNVSLDFSNISIGGIITISILGFCFCAIISIILRALKSVKINTEKLSIETHQMAETAKTKITPEQSKIIIKKQKTLANHYIMNMAGDLRELFYQNLELTKEEKNSIWILIHNMLLQLSSMVFDNFADNHIGETDAEIRDYTLIRAREYDAFIKSFFDEYDWLVPTRRLKNVFLKLPQDYLFHHLYQIYKDGKLVEKTAKEKPSA